MEKGAGITTRAREGGGEEGASMRISNSVLGLLKHHLGGMTSD